METDRLLVLQEWDRQQFLSNISKVRSKVNKEKKCTQYKNVFKLLSIKIE